MPLRIGGLAVFAIGLLCAVAAGAQDPTVAFPKNYRVLVDNADVTVLRVHYGPHETVGIHDHSNHPTVYVYLNDSGPVRFVHSEEARPFELVRPPTHTGAYRVSPGRRERHSVVNLGDTPSDYLRIELKNIPLHTFTREFREAAPQTLVPGTNVEYQNPVIRIERVVCSAASACALASKSAPSVLVAFSPAKVTNQPVPLTFDRPVAWLPVHTSANVKSAGHESLDMLRIVLLNEH